MGMNYLEGELRRTGDPEDVNLADHIAARLSARGEDVELPQGAQVASQANLEIILPPLSPETRKLIEQMRGDGYAIYETFGKSPAAFRPEGMRYWFLNHKLAERTAAPALLAFKKDPSESFLPGSQNISHGEQVKLIPEEQARVAKQYPGTELVVREGKVSEWTELAWKNFQETKVRIFGKDFGFNWTWTDDYESDEPVADRASVGYWDGRVGLHVLLRHPDRVAPDLGLASLVEIPRK